MFVFFQLSLELEQKGKKIKVFENPKYGQSNFFMPLKYHGNGEVIRNYVEKGVIYRIYVLGVAAWTEERVDYSCPNLWFK